MFEDKSANTTMCLSGYTHLDTEKCGPIANNSVG